VTSTTTPWETIHVVGGEDRVDVAIAAHEYLMAHHLTPPLDGPASVLATDQEHILPLLRINPDAIVYTGQIGQVSIDRLIECAMTGHKVVIAYDGTVEDFRYAASFGPHTPQHVVALTAPDIPALAESA
jgi:hypothetical protein